MNVNIIIKRGWLIVALMVFCILIAVLIAPLARTITGSGSVVVQSNRQIIQTPSGGVVSTILVKDGDKVTKGQPILQIDADGVQAEIHANSTQIELAQDAIARLRGVGTIKTKDQVVLAVATNSARYAEKEQIAAKIAEARSNIESSMAQLAAVVNQLEIRKSQRDKLNSLVQQGMYAPIKLADADVVIAELETQVAKINGEISANQNAVKIAEASLANMTAQNRKNDASQLVDLQGQLATLKAKQEQLQQQAERSVVRAPATGEVVGLSVHTVGSTLTQGQQIGAVVPSAEKLVIEARFPTAYADQLQKGQATQIHFQSLDQGKITPATGYVETVSGDSLSDPKGTEYIAARIALNSESEVKFANMVNSPLRPGFPVDAVVQVGTRTAFEYFLGPFLQRLHQGATQ